MRHDAVKIVGPKGAAAAALPIWTEHETIDDELTAAVEKLAQGLLSFGTVEYIVLGYAPKADRGALG